MKAYRLSVNLKAGLVLFAVLIALTSLVYTNRLVDRLREREQFLIELWATAQEQIASARPPLNPYLEEFQALDSVLTSTSGTTSVPAFPFDTGAMLEASRWAQSMPPPGEITLAADILRQGRFGIPAVIIDSTGIRPEVVIWQNLNVPEDTARARPVLLDRAGSMAERYEPIPIEIDFGGSELQQYIFYDESRVIRELRIFPYVQLLFIGLLILSGYLGFSYVRRSEQSSLWAGMAKEAAHQLGTPISSLMGWHELLREGEMPPAQRQLALDEIENDINRLHRVANRFSDIGSLPRLEAMPIAPVIASTADYMRRRIPQQGKQVHLDVSVPADLHAAINTELFEWVVENLIKNALDAIEAREGRIEITAQSADRRVRIEVKDSGKGIDRRQWKNVFRPGYSTKKRGWGLGLSLSKRIVEDYHGGTLVLAQSRVGQGTTFRIELPAA